MSEPHNRIPDLIVPAYIAESLAHTHPTRERELLTPYEAMIGRKGTPQEQADWCAWLSELRARWWASRRRGL